MISALRTITTLFFVVNFFSIQGQVSDPSPASTPAVPKPSREIFTVVEKNPEFPGGPDALKKYIADKIDPETIEVQGKVILQFVVELDGSMTDIKVARGLSPAQDSQAVRIVQAMPKWNPGMQRGKPVLVRYTLPVGFRNAQNYERSASESPSYAIGPSVTEASFPGGQQALKSFIDFTRNMNNIKEIVYSERMIPYVMVDFSVNVDGTITDVQSRYATNNDYRREALRIVGLMPNWTPEQVGGKARAKQVQLKIEFPNN